MAAGGQAAGKRHLLWTSLGSINQAKGKGTSKVCWLEAQQRSWSYVSLMNSQHSAVLLATQWPLLRS